MALRRLTVAAALASVAVFSTPTYAQDKPQQQDQQRKLSNDERREYFALNELVDAVAAGKQPAPADLKLTFHHHYLRSNKNVYIPYVLEAEGGKFASFPVGMYVRAVSKAGPPPAPETKPGEKPGTAPVNWPFADIYFLTEKNVVSAGDGAQIARAIELPAGEYTLYFALRERQPRDKKEQPKTAVLVQDLTVPDLHTGLTTSSVMLARSLDPAPEKLTAQQQLEQPFTISGYRIVPIFDAAIPQANELLFVFFIYNEGVAANGKPDLDVDYHFFRAKEDKPFTRLATQSFNATTLPGQFDVNLGHQVFVGQGIPLNNPAAPFAPGEYRMEIKVTDKTNGQSITRDIPFRVQ